MPVGAVAELHARAPLELRVRAGAALPAPTGPHELAWSYLLDHVFAHAYHSGISRLTAHLPYPNLVPEIELRASLTPGGAGGAALALLDFSPALPEDLDGFARLFVLSGGLLAPRAWRRREGPSGWVLAERRFVFTGQVRAWGALIRLANLARRPDLADRAIFAMRRDFSSPRPTPSFYVLSLWERP